MGQFKILEDLMLPLRRLEGALKILRIWQAKGGTIQQAAETALPRSSGRPPPLLVVRAPEKFWTVEGFALTSPFSAEKQGISSMPLLSSFDINGSGAGAQLVVLFDVKYQYYYSLWCEVPVLRETGICCTQSGLQRFFRMCTSRSLRGHSLEDLCFSCVVHGRHTISELVRMYRASHLGNRTFARGNSEKCLWESTCSVPL